MGLFDFLTGTKRPDKNIAPAPRSEVEQAILAINRETAPFQIVKDQSGKCDFIAEWKIVDAKWYEVFAKSGLKKVFRIKIRFDEDKKEVRATDEEFTLQWRAGVPSLTLAVTGFKGQKSEVSFGTAYAFNEKLEFGQVYKYRFNSSELKNPLRDAVVAKGWTWRGVAFGKL